MTTLEINGDWNITKGKLKQKWAQLTDDDLQFIEGALQEHLWVKMAQSRSWRASPLRVAAVNDSCAAGMS